MVKNFIIDTNVILNDPKCFFKFSENNVYIPTPVLQELDDFKDGKNVSLKNSARTAIRTIDQAISDNKANLMEGISLSNGGTLYSIPVPDLDNDPIEKQFGKRTDNDILKCLYQLSENRKEKSLLVTEDINLRVKANALKLNAEKYKNARVENLDFYQSKDAKVHVGQDIIDELYKKGHTKSIDTKDLSLKNNDFLVVKRSNERCIVQKSNDRFKIVRQDPISYGNIKPKNLKQNYAMSAIMNDDIKLVTLVGKAGTGKTILALSCGMERVMESNSKFDSLSIFRPTVSMGQSLGYLPGSVEEKLTPWMKPIKDNLQFIHSRQCHKEGKHRSLQELIEHDIIEIGSLSHVRGRSLNNKFVILDEAQNMNMHEMKTFISRAGKGTQVIVTGDPFQIDNNYLDKHSNGLTYLINNMSGDEIFCNVFLDKGERSELAEKAANKL